MNSARNKKIYEKHENKVKLKPTKAVVSLIEFDKNMDEKNNETINPQMNPRGKMNKLMNVFFLIIRLPFIVKIIEKIMKTKKVVCSMG
jgi:hypothetical protein